ncbi:MAG TPA: hypothetical protein VIC26_08685 [Marinagarivorans sp.]
MVRSLNVKKLPLRVALGVLMLPAASFANTQEDLSYSYVQGGYLVQDVDIYQDSDSLDDFIDDIDDGGGYKAEVSVGFAQNFFGFASYSDTEADFAFVDNNGAVIPSDTNVKTMRLGVGFHAPLTRVMDFVTTASYVDMDLGDFSFGQTDNDVIGGDDSLGDWYDDLSEDSSDGYSLDAGVRAQVTYWLELGGGLRYTDVDAGDDVSAFGNALFEINPNMGINLLATAGDNLSTYELAFRYSF